MRIGLLIVLAVAFSAAAIVFLNSSPASHCPYDRANESRGTCSDIAQTIDTSHVVTRVYHPSAPQKP